MDDREKDYTNDPKEEQTGEIEKRQEQKEQETEEKYEKVCYMCRRPESKAGPMITMPGNICL